MRTTDPTTTITAAQAAVAYWKAGELEEDYIMRERIKAIDIIKETKRCGFLWRNKRPITDGEREDLVASAEEDLNFCMQLVQGNANKYFNLSRSMKALPEDQEVTVPVEIAQLAF